MTKDSLKRVIAQYILSDPDLVLQHTKTPSGRFEEKMRVRVHQHALSQIMILVFFLDRAKTERVLTDDPNLFELESPLKSSDEILVSLCQDCFSKQSSILRHLAYDGIGVSHVQRPLDEYNFYVENLAVDLKDGVCLAKMIDVVTQRSNLLSWMRLPASSRQLRVHNVNFALSSLRQLGVKNISDITNAHVVDAHQPRILQLLWSSIMHFELPEFHQEIEVYRAATSIQMLARRFLAVKCYLKTCRAILLIQSSFRGYVARSSLSRLKFASVSIARVWRGYRAKIQYGFSLMAIITIQRMGRGLTTRAKVSKMTRDMNSAAVKIQRIWRGYSAVVRYGLSIFSIMTVQSLCRRRIASNQVARLIQMREERAAVAIQATWRGFCKRHKTKLIMSATIRVQRVCRGFLARRYVRRRVGYATKIQSVVRMWLANKKIDELLCAPPINVISAETLKPSKSLEVKAQRESGDEHFVDFVTYHASSSSSEQVSLMSPLADRLSPSKIDDELPFASGDLTAETGSINGNDSTPRSIASVKLLRQQAATTIQKIWRRKMAVEIHALSRMAVIMIQSAFRRHTGRHRYRATKSFAILIQKKFRGTHARNTFEKQRSAAVLIQSIARSCILSNHYLMIARSAVLIQTLTRKQSAVIKFREYRRCVIAGQSFCRGYLTRRRIALRQEKSVLVQAVCRGFLGRLQFASRSRAVATIQRAVRASFSKARAKIEDRAAILIQRYWRGYSENINYVLLQVLVTKLQALSRGRKAAHEFKRQKHASVILQRAARVMINRQNDRVMNFAATEIQRIWRGYQASTSFLFRIMHSMMIQASVRGMMARKKYRGQRASVMILQRASRFYLHRNKMRAATELQRMWRGFSSRKISYDTMLSSLMERSISISTRERESAIILQSHFRRIRATNLLRSRLRSAIKIQRAARCILERERTTALEHDAAVVIQSSWRSFSCNADFMIAILSAIKIQSFARQMLSKSELILLRRERIREQRVIRYPPLKMSGSPPTQSGIVAEDISPIQIARKVESPPSSSQHALESRGASVSSSLVEHVSAAARKSQDQRNRAVQTKHLLAFSQPSRQSPESRLHTSKCRLQDGFQPKRQALIGPSPHAAPHQSTSAHAKDDTNAIGRSNAEPNLTFGGSSDIGRSPQSASLLSGLSSLGSVEFDMSSKFAKHTLKAIRTLRRQKKLDEVRKATLNLDKITRQSEADCQLVIQAGGQHYLFRILGICNRSSPHIEIVRGILSILKNLARQVSVVADDSEVAVLTDVIQRFRDKSDIFALSSALLEGFLNRSPHLYSAYLTNENTRRLDGIIKQCRTTTSHLQDVLKGIACLENIISRV